MTKLRSVCLIFLNMARSDYMRIVRKHSIGALFFIVLGICLLAPFSFAGTNSCVAETFSLDRTVSLSSKVQPFCNNNVVPSALGHKKGGKAHSNFGICLRNLRMVLDEDWISKITSLNNADRFLKYSVDLCTRFRAILSVLVTSQVFHLSFSGLSPPSL